MINTPETPLFYTYSQNKNLVLGVKTMEFLEFLIFLEWYWEGIKFKDIKDIKGFSTYIQNKNLVLGEKKGDVVDVWLLII